MTEMKRLSIDPQILISHSGYRDQAIGIMIGLGTFQVFLAVPLTVSSLAVKKVKFQVAVNFKVKNGTSVR